MALLSDRLSITVTSNSPNITRTGFGTPLLYGHVGNYITDFGPSVLTKTYSGNTGLTDMATDGFRTTDPMYLAASALLGQSPRPNSFKIGKGTRDFSQIVNITPTVYASGNTITFNITKGGVTQTLSRPCGGVSIAAEVTAIVADLDGNVDGFGSSGTGELTFTDATTHIAITDTNGGPATSGAVSFTYVDSSPDTITRGAGSFVTDGFVVGDIVQVTGSALGNNGFYKVSNVAALTLTVTSLTGTDAGLVAETVSSTITVAHQKLYYYSSLTNCTIDDATANRGPGAESAANDINAIIAQDSDWYCLCAVDAFGGTELAVIADNIQDQTLKICCLGTQDSDNIGASYASAGIAYTLQAGTYTRSFLVFSKNSMSEYPAVAAAGRFLPKPPGEIVWADKSLTGVTPSSLSAVEMNRLNRFNDATTYPGANYCNYYVTTAGVGNLFPGVGAGGEFIDIVRLTDWTVTNVQEDIFSALRGSDKIPFTDEGVSTIEGIVLGVLRRKMPLGFAAGSEVFNAPLVADVSAANKAARRLPDVTFGATFAGAILYVDFVANLSY